LRGPGRLRKGEWGQKEEKEKRKRMIRSRRMKEKNEKMEEEVMDRDEGRRVCEGNRGKEKAKEEI
jgi:hypothetical protein